MFRVKGDPELRLAQLRDGEADGGRLSAWLRLMPWKLRWARSGNVVFAAVIEHLLECLRRNTVPVICVGRPAPITAISRSSGGSSSGVVEPAPSPPGVGAGGCHFL